MRREINFDTMSSMKTTREQGSINLLLIPLILASVFLIAALSFGVWAFNGRQDYKNHSDRKVAAAVAVAVTNTQASDAVRAAEAAKSPFKTYVGPEAYGSVTLQYPKTWSAYIVNGGNSPLNAWFHPDYVPSVDSSAAFSLRVSVVTSSYSSILAGYTNLVQNKKLTATPYSLPKVPSVSGMRLDGQLTASKRGSIVILPLRNVTLEIWTESNDFMSDYNNTILSNITFSP